MDWESMIEYRVSQGPKSCFEITGLSNSGLAYIQKLDSLHAHIS